MKIGSTLLWAFAAACAGAGLFVLKGQVQAEERRLTELNHEIVDTRNGIHVMNANWAFLNDPSRLSEEAQTLLALQPLGPNQIGSIEQIPIGPRDPEPSGAAPGGVPGSVPVAGAAPAKPMVLASGKPATSPFTAIIAAKAPPKPAEKLPAGTKVLAPAQKAAAAQAAKSAANAAKPTTVATAKPAAKSASKSASKSGAASAKPVAELTPGSTVKPLNFGARPAAAQAARAVPAVPPTPVAVPRAQPVNSAQLKIVPAKDVTR